MNGFVGRTLQSTQENGTGSSKTPNPKEQAHHMYGYLEGPGIHTVDCLQVID